LRNFIILQFCILLDFSKKNVPKLKIRLSRGIFLTNPAFALEALSSEFIGENQCSGRPSPAGFARRS